MRWHVDNEERPGAHGRALTSPRGSALILVLLVLLSLSAIGMVGMRNVTRSMQQSGTYRARAAADTYADAAGQFMAYQLGNRAQEIWGSMKRYENLQRDDYESQYSQNSELTKRRNAETRQGETMRFVYDPSGANVRNDLSSFLDQQTLNNDGSGLFTWKSNQTSFENRSETSRLEIVLRNPVNMPAPSGYSDEYCFKKVTIAVEAQLGNPKSDWDEPRPIGAGRTLFETMVGPIQCQS